MKIKNLDNICVFLQKFDLNNDQLRQLKDVFYQNKQEYGHLYKSETGRKTELLIVGGFNKTRLIESLLEKIDNFYIDNFYFVSNYGIKKHIDDNRQCVISWEIQNDFKTPIDFYVNDKKTSIIYKNNNPIMFNPQICHGAPMSKTERIFFQIELNRKFNFLFYVNLFKSYGYYK